MKRGKRKKMGDKDNKKELVKRELKKIDGYNKKKKKIEKASKNKEVKRKN